jgi:hypothetical protein
MAVRRSAVPISRVVSRTFERPLTQERLQSAGGPWRVDANASPGTYTEVVVDVRAFDKASLELREPDGGSTWSTAFFSVQRSITGRPEDAVSMSPALSMDAAQSRQWSVDVADAAFLHLALDIAEGGALELDLYVYGAGLAPPFDVAVIRSPVESVLRGSHVHKFGYNPSLSTTIEEIWTGSTAYTWLSAAQTISIVSTSANDTAAGTRARELTVQGLDATGALQTIAYALNGTTPVVSTETWLRVFRYWVSKHGTYYVSGQTNMANDGAITINGTGAGTPLIGHIAVLSGQSEQAIYTVPLGFKAVIESLTIHLDAVKTLSGRLYKRENILDASGDVSSPRVMHRAPGIAGFAHLPFYEEIPELTDIWFEAELDAGSAAVTVDWDMHLEPV